MVHMTPGDPPKLPVEQLAQFLLGCAREDPTLLARSNLGPSPGQFERARLPPRLATEKVVPIQLQPAGSKTEQDVEQLVSIAVACARRAEDALQHARDVSLSARRRMSMVAAITATGILAASAALVLDRFGGVADAKVANAAGVVGNAPERRVSLEAVGTGSDPLAAQQIAPPPRAVGSEDTRAVARQTELKASPVSSPPAAVASELPTPRDTVTLIRPQALPRPAPLPPAIEVTAAEPETIQTATVGPPITPAAIENSETPTRPAATLASTPAQVVERPAPPVQSVGSPSIQSRPNQAQQVAVPRHVTPTHPLYHEARYYRRRFAPPPTPPVVFAQFVAGVRRGIFSIFH